MFERSYESIRVFATDAIISQVILPRALLQIVKRKILKFSYFTNFQSPRDSRRSCFILSLNTTIRAIDLARK